LDVDKFDRASDCAGYGKNDMRRTSHGSVWKFHATRQIDYFSMPPPSYPLGTERRRSSGTIVGLTEKHKKIGHHIYMIWWKEKTRQWHKIYGTTHGSKLYKTKSWLQLRWRSLSHFGSDYREYTSTWRSRIRPLGSGRLMANTPPGRHTGLSFWVL